MADKRPILVIKRPSQHSGHSGGAWKVAYADFVTAMMALFIVLWLMNSSRQIQVAVGGYFKDPSGNSKLAGSNQAGSGENFTVTKDNMDQLKAALEDSVRQMANFDQFKNQIKLALELAKLPNKISIEGHTDSKPFVGKGDYGNWELSTDRANAARRLMQQAGLRDNQVTQVRGYADQKLRKPSDPLDPGNRRISLIVQYVVKDHNPQ
jgi:chemotaxis protein MotB